MALIFLSDLDKALPWKTELEALKPDIDFRLPQNSTDRTDEINYVLVSPEHCPDLHRYGNLKAIFSLYAGVDELLKSPQKLPAQVPLIRLISADLSLSMCQYVVLHCLNHLRRQDEYREQASSGLWQPLQIDNNRLRVGILGLGEIGQVVGEKLSELGFEVAGWSRSPKQTGPVVSFSGAAQLPAFLARSHILVSLLPLTATTTDFINTKLFSQLPKGACFINVGRGKQVVESDLIASLESGQLSAATLDVFRTEPLPDSHPFWQHSKITLTPHIASETRPCRDSAQWIVDNITSIDSGGSALGGVVDRQTGY